MKRVLTNFFSLILCATLVVSAAGFCVIAEDNANVVYVNRDTGDDSADDAVYTTLQAAFDALGGKDGTVVVTNTVSAKNDGSANSFDGTITLTGGNVLVTSIDPVTQTDYTDTAFLAKYGRAIIYVKNGGCLTFDDVTYINTSSSDFDIREGNIVFGDGYSYKAGSAAASPTSNLRIAIGGSQTASAPSDISLDASGYKGAIYSGYSGIQTATSSNTYIDDLTMSFGAANTGDFYLGATGNSNRNINVNNIFVDVTDNSGLNLIKGTKSGITGCTVKIGAIQVIFKNSSGSTFEASTNIGTNDSFGPEYIVNVPSVPTGAEVASAEMGKVNVTVPTGYKATISNGDSSAEILTSGTVTLSEGETNITFEAIRDDVVYLNYDHADNMLTFASLQAAADALPENGGTIVVSNTNFTTASFNNLTVTSGDVIITSIDPITGYDYRNDGAALYRDGRRYVAAKNGASITFENVIDGKKLGSDFRIIEGNVNLGKGFKAYMNYTGTIVETYENFRVSTSGTGGVDIKASLNFEGTCDNNTVCTGIGAATVNTSLNKLDLTIGSGLSGYFFLGATTGAQSTTVSDRTFIDVNNNDSLTIVRGNAATYTNASTLNGLQIIFKNSAGSHIEDSANSGYSNTVGEYIVYAETNGIEGADVATTALGSVNVTIPAGCAAYVTQQSGETTVYRESTSLALTKNAETYIRIDTDDLSVEDLTHTESNTDFSSDLVVNGVQIRTSGKQALRFVASVGSDLLEKASALDSGNVKPDSVDDTGIGYGFVVLPEKLAVGELTKNTENAAVVPAVNLFNEKADHKMFTVCITDIETANYKNGYSVRPYITYNDANGNEHTVYGEIYTSSVYSTAEYGYENETDESAKAVLKSLMDAYDALGIQE